MNLTLFQFFHWYHAPDGTLWKHVADEAEKLSNLGITHVWLPPAYKSALGATEPGYAVYDLYDLGEFDQKGTVATKYGSKDDYLKAIQTLHNCQVEVLADIVFNHRLCGDETEKIAVAEVDDNNRLEVIQDNQIIQVDSRFTFPGREGKYSNFIWDSTCFTGIMQQEKLYLIPNEHNQGKWDDLLEEERGNYDYLMGYDVEFRNPFVVDELKAWGKWYIETTRVDGFRLDALKHINLQFFPQWLEYLDQHFSKTFFCIGEYWRSDVQSLLKYINVTGGRIQLFDVPLHYNFSEASKAGADYDLRKLLDNTLVQQLPEKAITFVDNHDTQPLQSLASPVENWFQPMAYAIILLRIQGIPVVFYPALYEAYYRNEHDDADIRLPRNNDVERMITIRKLLAYGEQVEYWDDPHIIGWTRQGDAAYPLSGCAVLISNGESGEKKMSMGVANAFKTFRTVCGDREEYVELDENGEGIFLVNAGTVSVWVNVETNLL